MTFDDGTSALVPLEKVADAVKDGGKVAQHMKFDDGTSALVPLERVHDAMKDGGMIIGAALQPPNVTMQPGEGSTLGAIGNALDGPAPTQPQATERAMQQTMGGAPMYTDVPKGTKENFEKAGNEGYEKGGVIGAGLVTGAGTVAAVAPAVPKVIEAANAVGTWAKANPIKALAIESIARELGIDPFQLTHKIVKFGKNLFGE
jgi:hypothetical protein